MKEVQLSGFSFLKSFLDMDEAVRISLLNRLFAMLAGPITIFLILKKLSPVEQGYYYSISSLLSLQIFFELGIGMATLVTVSHMMKALKFDSDSKNIVGDEIKRYQLARFFRDTIVWYIYLCLLFISIVMIVGYFILNNTTEAKTVEWVLPWIFCVLFFGLNIVISGVWFFLPNNCCLRFT